jgi:hypothetical protein
MVKKRKKIVTKLLACKQSIKQYAAKKFGKNNITNECQAVNQ